MTGSLSDDTSTGKVRLRTAWNSSLSSKTTCIGEFVGYLIRCLIAPAFVWVSDILIGLPDNLIQAIAAVWLVVMSIFVPTAIERMIDGF